jgi:hypothetical protein
MSLYEDIACYRSLPIRSNSDKSEGVPILTSERGGSILQLPPESTQLGILGVHYYDARGKVRVTYGERHYWYYQIFQLLETGVRANDCKCSRDQRLNVPSEARKLRNESLYLLKTFGTMWH